MAIRWFGRQVVDAFSDEAKDRVTTAAIVLSRYAKERMVERDNLHGGNASEPGEYPAKVTGHLSGDVSWLHDKDAEGHFSHWGTNVAYGRSLQVFKNRPWMSRANAEKSIEVKAILGAPL